MNSQEIGQLSVHALWLVMLLSLPAVLTAVVVALFTAIASGTRVERPRMIVTSQYRGETAGRVEAMGRMPKYSADSRARSPFTATASQTAKRRPRSRP